MREEVAVVVAKDDVGDDLRLGRVLFDLAAWTEPVVRAHPGEQLVKTGRPKARPFAAAKQRVPRNDQDILARAHGLSLAVLFAGGVCISLMIGTVAVVRRRRPHRRLRCHLWSRFGRGLLADDDCGLRRAALQLLDPIWLVTGGGEPLLEPRHRGVAGP